MKAHGDGKDLKQSNPTLKSILKVEKLLKENIEFDSKSQLLRKLDGSMKASVLDIILRYLAKSNKILFDKDGSIVWIDATNNKKLKTSYRKAVKL